MPAKRAIKGTKKPFTIYLVPHSHYDVVWIFTKEDYAFINCDLIIRKALEIMEKDPNYRFIVEQTYLLDTLRREYPDMWPILKERVKEGRIEIVDGQYLMPDLRMPTGEVLVRLIQTGKKFVKDNFGKDVDVAWSADAFGQNAQMPQICLDSDYKWIAFRRGMSLYGPTDFIWEGLDGSQIQANWWPLGYRAGLDLSEIRKNYQIIKKLDPTDAILMPAGSGVTIPQDDTGKFVDEWNKNNKDVKIKLSTPQEYFEYDEKYLKKFEIIKDEFNCGKYSEVFPGTLSSRMWVKLILRKLERLLIDAEKFATLAWLFGAHYPHDTFETEWRNVFLVAFHDVISGCAVDEVYDEVKINYERSKKILDRIIYSSLKCITQHIRSQTETGRNLAVFNSLSWDVTNCVEIELKFEFGEANSFKIFEATSANNKALANSVKKTKRATKHKTEIPYQILEMAKYSDRSIEHIKIAFIANDVPALGYKLFVVEPSKDRKKMDRFEHEFKVDNHTVENKFYRIEFDQINGIINQIYDKVNKKEVMGDSNEIYLESDCGDLYYHQYKEQFQVYQNDSGTKGIKYGVIKVSKFKVTERGPVRLKVIIRAEYYPLRWPYRLLGKMKPLLYKYKKIEFKKEIIIYNDIPRIEFRTLINNRHPNLRIRLKFDTRVRNKKYASETQFGVIERKTNEYYTKPNPKWKETPNGVYPTLNWIDYSDKKGGICLINDGIPSHEVRDNSIYMTLLRSVNLLSSTGAGATIPTMDAQEFRSYEFRYALYPHQGTWQDSQCYKQAYEFNHGLLPMEFETKASGKKLSAAKSFLRISPNNLVLSALKKAEDDDSIIIRFFDTAGKRSKGEIKFYRDLKSAKSVNLLEMPRKLGKGKGKGKNNGKITRTGRDMSLEVDKFKIHTLKLKLKGEQWKR